ncbi:MAG: ATP-dependent 6-phosphofructokinase [Candidatus Cloacimonetes bacterium]|nr:ATP-dependent 6-phosphofructokinase [Candidatus Cloacimonadota bacterium]
MKKRCLVLTGGGDCPGLNAVIRAIVKRADKEPDWEIIGSIDAYNGILNDPMEYKILDNKAIAGIHVKGGTILGTTNKGGPFNWPIETELGEWKTVDRSDELLERFDELNVKAVISIGGDGSQSISQKLYEKGCNIIGIPKTIDNDLSSTDYTFGFQTAVEIATEALDKLVTTAESHHRIMILEVMGRDAGWIALHTAIAGGAEVCLIPEIAYDVDKIKKSIEERTDKRGGFANIVIAEGTHPQKGKIVAQSTTEIGYENIRLGGVGFELAEQLKKTGMKSDIRTTILGHIQRGGIPIAYDRILATRFGVKALEMVLDGDFGKMVAYKHPDIIGVTLQEAIASYNYIDLESNLIKTARGIGISFGD